MADAEPLTKKKRVGVRVVPIRPDDKDLAFGAEVHGVDLADVSDADFEAVRAALHDHLFLVFPGQDHVDPEQVASFTKRFDPDASTVWRDQSTNLWERHKAEHMGPAGTFQLPPPRSHTLVIGKGEVRNHFGLTAELGGARAAYGSAKGSQVIGGGKLQWHLDGAFWAAGGASGLPCKVVCMRCCESPFTTDKFYHNIDYGDGAILRCPLGATAFCSAYRAYELLSAHEQERALRTTVHYAGHPFKKFASLGMTQDGVRCTGKSQVATSEIQELGRLSLPLVWCHPITGRRALMPHTRCLESLEVAGEDGNCKIGLEEARTYLHTLMRRAVEPCLVYAHAWEPGQVALWDNHGVWHSATGGLRDTDRRVMHLVAFDGAYVPRGPPTAEASGKPSVLALVIGEGPRPDLVDPLRLSLKEKGLDIEVVVRGALDNMSEYQLHGVTDCAGFDGSCPLITRLANGRAITVSESALGPLLQRQLDFCMPSTSVCAVLLCAGGFAALRAPRGSVLVRPSEVAAATVRTLGIRRAALLVPTQEQRAAGIARWQRRCPDTVFEALLRGVEADEKKLAAMDGAAVIIDFVGHGDELAASLRRELPDRIILDVGAIAREQVAALCSAM